MTGSPSLSAARRRVEWAARRQHELGIVSATVQKHFAANPFRLRMDKAAYERGEDSQVEVDWSGVAGTPSTIEITMMASEVVNHLRTALDYVAYNIAWLDSKRVREYTKFPIVYKAAQWNRELQSSVKGVTPEHGDTLRDYQPFADCEWTAELSRLSRLDKHQELVELARRHGGTFRLDAESVRDDPNDPTHVLIAVRDPEAVFEFDDESDVMPRLDAFQAGVIEVINRFARDFEH